MLEFYNIFIISCYLYYYNFLINYDFNVQHLTTLKYILYLISTTSKTSQDVLFLLLLLLSQITRIHVFNTRH